MDELKQLLGEELFEQVTEKLGDKKLLIDDGKYIHNVDGAYIPRKVFNEDKKKLKDQIDELTGKIEALQKAGNENEKLQEQLKELSEKLQTVSTESEARLLESERIAKIETALIKSGANDAYIDFLKTKIDSEVVKKSESGEWIGLDQINGLKESFPVMFGTQKVVGEPPPGGEPTPAVTDLQKQYTAAVEQFGKSSPQAIAVKNEAFRKGEPIN
ncbi:MAG: phage scaffolding protein [Deltaproteobacteria bacterium]|nr:phage scaffolding protein [Deltaproteobacteria bacterium]